MFVKLISMFIAMHSSMFLFVQPGQGFEMRPILHADFQTQSFEACSWSLI
uniref:Uncharacterized protein n=1 Tax=Arion vulgaris TaxID=1028688 RepID=A0A0B6XZ36_9EUPU